MNQLAITAFLTPLGSKWIRVLIIAFCAFLTGHDYGGFATIISSHSSEITTAIIGGLATLIYHFWMSYKDTAFGLRARSFLGLPADATHAETLTVAKALMTVAIDPGLPTGFANKAPEMVANRILATASTTGLIALLVAASLPLGACTSMQFANVKKGVTSDIQSPASKTLAADLFSSAVNILAAASAKGTNPEADVAAMNSLAGVFESYSALPTTEVQLQDLASNAASLSPTIQAQTPQIVALVQKGIKGGLTPETALQQVASGVYAATGVAGQ